MADLEQVFRTIDQLTPEEKQQVVAYIQAQHRSGTSTQPRTPGLFPGIWMSDDFDDELPDSFWPGKKSGGD